MNSHVKKSIYDEKNIFIKGRRDNGMCINHGVKCQF